MSLISQPGSDYQAAHLTLDAGNARDIMLLLLDAHACSWTSTPSWTTSTSTAPSPRSLTRPTTTCANPPAPTPSPPLIGALDDVITILTRAIRDTGPPTGP
jgi:hypothetical protein